MNENMDSMDCFVNLSALLTGIAAGRLAPSVDPVDVKRTYFDYARERAGDTFSKLLEIYDRNRSRPPATIADIIFNQSGDDIRDLARSIMLAWYLGSWYDLQKGYPMQVISSKAYTQGWAWNVAQAHPMGYSNLRFGYWAGDPPRLADFVEAKQ